MGRTLHAAQILKLLVAPWHEVGGLWVPLGIPFIAAVERVLVNLSYLQGQSATYLQVRVTCESASGLARHGIINEGRYFPEGWQRNQIVHKKACVRSSTRNWSWQRLVVLAKSSSRGKV